MRGLLACVTRIELDFGVNDNFTGPGLMKALASGLPANATSARLNFNKNRNFTDDGLEALTNTGLRDSRPPGF